MSCWQHRHMDLSLMPCAGASVPPVQQSLSPRQQAVKGLALPLTHTSAGLAAQAARVRQGACWHHPSNRHAHRWDCS